MRKLRDNTSDPTSHDQFKNHFLIAMPQLLDPHFSHSITLICDHSTEGAMGIVINRPLEMTLEDIFQTASIDAHVPADILQQPIYLGGPVQPDRGFILHTGPKVWQGTISISDWLHITSSNDILTDIAKGQGPENFLFALGYAGWTAGQLENEIANNHWLVTPCEPEILFATPAEQRWQASAKSMGFDINLLSTHIGHA